MEDFSFFLGCGVLNLKYALSIDFLVEYQVIDGGEVRVYLSGERKWENEGDQSKKYSS